MQLQRKLFGKFWLNRCGGISGGPKIVNLCNKFARKFCSKFCRIFESILLKLTENVSESGSEVCYLFLFLPKDVNLIIQREVVSADFLFFSFLFRI